MCVTGLPCRITKQRSMRVTIAAIGAAVTISHPAPTQLCWDVKVTRGRAQGRARHKALQVGSLVWARTRLGRFVSHSWDHMCEHVPEGGTNLREGDQGRLQGPGPVGLHSKLAPRRTLHPTQGSSPHLCLLCPSLLEPAQLAPLIPGEEPHPGQGEGGRCEEESEGAPWGGVPG